MCGKARHGNEKQVREAFEDFGSALSNPSSGKVRESVRYFAADLIQRIRPPALQAATLSSLNRNTNRFYRGLRERILLDCEARRPLFAVVEVDGGFFGARRVKGWRGYNGLVDLGYGHFRVDHSHPKNPSLGRVRQTRRVRTPSGGPQPWGCPRGRHRRLLGAGKVQRLHTPSTCTSRKPNGGTTIAMPTSTKPCHAIKVGLFGSAKTYSPRQDP